MLGWGRRCQPATRGTVAQRGAFAWRELPSISGKHARDPPVFRPGLRPGRMPVRSRVVRGLSGKPLWDRPRYYYAPHTPIQGSRAPHTDPRCKPRAGDGFSRLKLGPDGKPTARAAQIMQARSYPCCAQRCSAPLPPRGGASWLQPRLHTARRSKRAAASAPASAPAERAGRHRCSAGIGVLSSSIVACSLSAAPA